MTAGKWMAAVALGTLSASAETWTDAAEAFGKTAGAAESCTVCELPSWADVNRWHLVGGKVFLEVKADPGASAARARRMAGFAAFRAGVDGVKTEGELPPAWREQLAFAERDTAAAKRLVELADRAIGSGDATLALEGRRARAFLFAGMDPATDDLDLDRLEILALIRRLEVRLGEKPSEPDLPSEPKERDIVRMTADPAAFKECKLFNDNQGRPFNDRIGFTYCGGLVLHMSGNAGRKMKPTAQNWVQPGTEFPNDGVYKVNLWVPTGTKDDFLGYRYEIDMKDGSIRDIPTRTYDAHYRKLIKLQKLYHYTCTADGKWSTYLLELSPGALYGFAQPSATVGRTDSWYMEVVYPTGRTDRIRLVFPAGSKKTIEGNFSSYDFASTETAYAAAMSAAETKYGAWYPERFLKFPKTDPETFALGDAESDQLFCNVVLRTIKDRNRKILELIHMKPVHNYTPEVLRSGPVVRQQVERRILEIRDMKFTIEKARKDYIVGRFAGKKPTYVPPKEEPKAPEKAKGPSLDDDSNALELDEEAI